MRRPIAAATAALLACASAACTTHPDNVTPRYVSPIAYSTWDCAQLLDERNRLIAEVRKFTDLQRENAQGDAVMMTVGLVVFWPVLIGMAATKDRKEDLARVKGEYEAVEAAARNRPCTLPPPPAAAPPPERPAATPPDGR
jgi:hypothetical protein